MARSLDEVIEGYKQMSAAFGFTPTGSSMQSLMSTPPPPPPPVMHPGAAAMSLFSGGVLPPSLPQASTMPGVPNSMAPMTPSVPQAPPTPATLPHAAASIGGIPRFNYAAQANTNQSYQMAQLAPPVSGASIPPAIYNTAPAFGNFRPQTGPYAPGMMSGMPMPGLLPPPMPSSPLFTPYGAFANTYGQNNFAYDMANQNALNLTAARGGIGAAGMWMGSGLGAAAGAMVGGVGGARVGGLIGGAAMGLGAALSPLPDALMSYSVHNNINAARIQDMSQRWISQDPGMGGLTRNDSHRVSQALSSFAGQSNGLFNRRDMMNIMQSAGDNGLFEFANNAESIIGQVKNVARAVAAIARVSGDPDLKAHIRTIGELSRQGLSVSESTNFMTGLGKSLGRGARFNVTDAMTGDMAMAGAAMFQGAGLTGGAGALSSVYGFGTGRMAMQAGAIGRTQAALLGGEQGMAQHTAQTHAAFLQGPGGMLLAAALGANGSGLDSSALKRLTSGGMDISDLVVGAAGNLNSPRAISNFMSRRKELSSQMANELGPQGMEMAIMKLGMGMQQYYGGSEVMGLGSVFERMGMSNDAARMYEEKAMSPQYWRDMQRQVSITDRERAATEGRRIMGGKSYARQRLGKAWDNLTNTAVFSAGSSAGDDEYTKSLASQGMEYVGNTRIMSPQDADFWASRATTKSSAGTRGYLNDFDAGLQDVRNSWRQLSQSAGWDDDETAYRRDKGGIAYKLGDSTLAKLVTRGVSIGDAGFAIGDTIAGAAFGFQNVENMKAQDRAAWRKDRSATKDVLDVADSMTRDDKKKAFNELVAKEFNGDREKAAEAVAKMAKDMEGRVGITGAFGTSGTAIGQSVTQGAGGMSKEMAAKLGALAFSGVSQVNAAAAETLKESAGQERTGAAARLGIEDQGRMLSSNFSAEIAQVMGEAEKGKDGKIKYKGIWGIIPGDRHAGMGKAAGRLKKKIHDTHKNRSEDVKNKIFAAAMLFAAMNSGNQAAKDEWIKFDAKTPDLAQAGKEAFLSVEDPKDQDAIKNMAANTASSRGAGQDFMQTMSSAGQTIEEYMPTLALADKAQSFGESMGMDMSKYGGSGPLHLNDDFLKDLAGKLGTRGDKAGQAKIQKFLATKKATGVSAKDKEAAFKDVRDILAAAQGGVIDTKEGAVGGGMSASARQSSQQVMEMAAAASSLQSGANTLEVAAREMLALTQRWGQIPVIQTTNDAASGMKPGH